MHVRDLLQSTEAGLYCPPGDFFIDPWVPVPRAVITHAHADHARPGSGRYLVARPCAPFLRLRLGAEATIDTCEYGEKLTMSGVTLSLHPAGHIRGSAQVRLDCEGYTAVISGDYKRAADRTAEAFEPVPCHAFVTEATFALPIFRWRDEADVFAEINGWWRQCRARQRTAVLFAYAIGKAQRVLAGLDASIGPIGAHGAILRYLPAYRDAGVALPDVMHARPETRQLLRGSGLVIAPPSADATPWLRRFQPCSRALASGWMQIRGPRRRRSLDRGFVLSDHADWRGVLDTVRETGAEFVGVTHGYTSQLARYLKEQGYQTAVYPTRFDDADERADSAGEGE